MATSPVAPCRHVAASLVTAFHSDHSHGFNRQLGVHGSGRKLDQKGEHATDFFATNDKSCNCTARGPCAPWLF